MQENLDLDRYPLDQPGTPAWDAMVAKAKAELAETGMFNLPGFLKPAAQRAAVVELAPRFAGESFTHARKHNVYFRKEVPGLAADHPALTLFETINKTLCGDQIGGSIKALYEWPPLARVNAMQYGAGEGLNWHFDRSEFTTTLLLQAPEAGGAFEYRTDLRSAEDPNYDGVARLLTGQDPDLQSITLEPGTLNVFRGKNTAHRVTPVQGDTTRIIAVFSFYEKPGVRFTEEEQRGFYGRAA